MGGKPPDVQVGPEWLILANILMMVETEVVDGDDDDQNVHLVSESP